MSVRYHSQTVRKETLHTISLVAPHMDRGMSVLDVGCGDGYVIEELAARGAAEVHGVDILDMRRNKNMAFSLYDGQRLPFADNRFDMVMLSFVLHHVPDDGKIALLREALRVSRGKVFIAEDTPTTCIDRLFSNRHGESYRRRIDSAAPFGFLSPTEWRWLFRGMGVEAESRVLSRFCRSVLQPFARTAFVVRKPTRPVAAAVATPVRISPGTGKS
ncbi:MAG TPA: methyltransferase domain-containing protein [Polyangia bacterium]|jgi:SAM-dependent methyltransferase|nr:methyltransferase domain-containing protein [Polyangia bacterium]